MLMDYLNRIPQTRNAGVILLIITALMWSLGGLFIKLIHWHPMAISGIRSLIAAGFLLAIRPHVPYRLTRPVIIGGLLVAATLVLFVISNKMTTAANAILLQYTAPVYVALFGFWILGEKTSKRDWITIGIVFLGLFLFFIDHLSKEGMIGNILACVSGLSFGCVALMLRKYRNTQQVDILIAGNILAAILGIPFIASGPMPDTQSIIVLIVMGIVQLGFPYLLYTQALKRVRAVEAIMIPMIEPILNPLWVFLVVGEIPGFWAFVGGVVVIGALTYHAIGDFKQHHHEISNG